MAEGARLESVCTLIRTEGSNPSLSARFNGSPIGASATRNCEPRQARKGAAAAVVVGAGMSLVGLPPFTTSFIP